jgi:hypothetical protein
VRARGVEREREKERKEREKKKKKKKKTTARDDVSERTRERGETNGRRCQQDGRGDGRTECATDGVRKRVSVVGQPDETERVERVSAARF